MGCWCEGGDEGQAEAGRQAQAFVDAQALLVQRHRHQFGAGGGQAVARADGAGVLEPHAVAGVEQHGRHQLEGLLRAADDEHLLRVAGDAAVGAQVQRNGLAQRRVAEGLTVAHHVVARAAPVAGRQPRPQRQRKGVEGRQRGGEGACGGRQPRAVGQSRQHLRHRGRKPHRAADVGTRLPGGRRHRRAHVLADEGPGADARLDQSFGSKAVVGLDHGGARHLQFTRQRAAGRQPLARGHGAGDDELAQRDVQLAADRTRRIGVDRYRQQQRAACSFDHRVGGCGRSTAQGRKGGAGNGITNDPKWTCRPHRAVPIMGFVPPCPASAVRA